MLQNLTNAFKTVKDFKRRIDELQRKPDQEVLPIFQIYEEMRVSEDVMLVVETALSYREEIRIVEEDKMTVNVMEPNFLASREEQRRRGPSSLDRVSIDSLPHQLYEMELLLEQTWGVVLMVSTRLHPEETEHHEEIISGFERLFQRDSAYLHSLALESTSIIETIALNQLHYGDLSVDVVLAALYKHHPSSVEELQGVLQLLEQYHIPVTLSLAEQFEKAFVRCMTAKKAEAEKVFRTMVELGFPPLSNRPFAILLNLDFLEVPAVMEYYELMLDYGIKPQSVLLRILCKKCKSDHEYALRHFTLLSKMSIDNAENDPELVDKSRRAGLNFFHKRLEKLGQDGEHHGKQSVPLLEAMKTLHRLEVEGIELRDDVYIPATLLMLFCHGNTVHEDLEPPFYLSKAYSAKKVERERPVNGNNSGDIETREERQRLADGVDDKRVGANTNAFDFNLTDEVNELLEDDESSVEEMYGEDLSLSKAQQNDMHGLVATATVEEETEYVLKVLELMNWVPNELLLVKVHEATLKAEPDPRMLIILGVLVFHHFEVNRRPRDVQVPLPCFLCVNLVKYYNKHHQKQRVSELIKEVAHEYYDFAEVYQLPWVQNTDHRQSEDNERAFRNVISFAACPGRNVDWCLGLLTLGLLIGAEAPAGQQLRKRILSFATDSPYPGTHLRTIEELQRCEWDRQQIFHSTLLMYGHSSGSPNTGNGTQGMVDGEEGGLSISSATSRRNGLDERRTLDDYLHIALRDINLDRKVIEWYRKRLMSQGPPRR